MKKYFRHRERKIHMFRMYFDCATRVRMASSCVSSCIINRCFAVVKCVVWMTIVDEAKNRYEFIERSEEFWEYFQARKKRSFVWKFYLMTECPGLKLRLQMTYNTYNATHSAPRRPTTTQDDQWRLIKGSQLWQKVQTWELEFFVSLFVSGIWGQTKTKRDIEVLSSGRMSIK